MVPDLFRILIIWCVFQIIPHLFGGAGVILSNVRLDRKEISVKTESNLIPTGLRKFGAIVGDRAEIGCNTVISPGSIIGRNSFQRKKEQSRQFLAKIISIYGS